VFFYGVWLDEFTSYAFRVVTYIFYSASSNNCATIASAIRAHIYEMVAGADDIRVVLDDDNGIAFVY
jgi:hypothetical protein